MTVAATTASTASTAFVRSRPWGDRGRLEPVAEAAAGVGQGTVQGGRGLSGGLLPAPVLTHGLDPCAVTTAARKLARLIDTMLTRGEAAPCSDARLCPTACMRLALKTGVHSPIVRRQISAAPPTSVVRIASG